MDKGLRVDRALVLRLSGQLGELPATAAGVLTPLVVLDLRDVRPLTAADAEAVHAFIRLRAEEGIRCHVVVDPTGAAAQTLTAIGALSLFSDLDRALTNDDEQADTSTLAEQLESLTRTLLGETSVAATLEQIIKAATIVIPAADLVSVTIRTPEGEFTTPVETSVVAGQLDQVQYESGKGPCVDAARPEGPGYVLSEDLAHERRWPEFAAAATQRGYRCVLATELLQATGSGRPSGALNIYCRQPYGFSDTERHLALLLATHASLALANTQTSELAELAQTQLRQAIDTRDVIGQAKGILMNRQGITAEEAFDLLRKTSQSLNVKLVDIARTLTIRHGELDVPTQDG
ncbi:GAF and ANTAR domain-containing protein [Amycolatopsis pithecellobii]|uniref:ANTAR domain-containing protein n=1 Tax=Amycolatopsis pithecellobii TaxID=664692 RepID=A0A6N7YZV3_9PSEU|nr:GAF and ANTAR domain-containing protein [Amycolatopsis pithecellobii]MTD54483.1 ANTAR domain-containing protein [Amycolatopsis pithecellobii]